ncbi:MAG: cupin domain-containing protein [Bacillota bacterium]
MKVVRTACREQARELPGHSSILGSVLSSEGGLRVVFSECKAGGHSDPHTHDTVQAFFVLKGKMEITCDGSIHQLEEGDFAMVFPGELHSVRSDDASYLAIMRAKVG